MDSVNEQMVVKFDSESNVFSEERRTDMEEGDKTMFTFPYT